MEEYFYFKHMDNLDLNALSLKVNFNLNHLDISFNFILSLCEKNKNKKVKWFNSKIKIVLYNLHTYSLWQTQCMYAIRNVLTQYTNMIN